MVDARDAPLVRPDSECGNQIPRQGSNGEEIIPTIIFRGPTKEIDERDKQTNKENEFAFTIRDYPLHGCPTIEVIQMG